MTVLNFFLNIRFDIRRRAKDLNRFHSVTVLAEHTANSFIIITKNHDERTGYFFKSQQK
jgi:hypothetical protein